MFDWSLEKIYNKVLASTPPPQQETIENQSLQQQVLATSHLHQRLVSCLAFLARPRMDHVPLDVWRLIFNAGLSRDELVYLKKVSPAWRRVVHLAAPKPLKL